MMVGVRGMSVAVMGFQGHLASEGICGTYHEQGGEEKRKKVKEWKSRKVKK